MGFSRAQKVKNMTKTQQSTEVVESLKNVSRLNLEIEFRFNKK